MSVSGSDPDRENKIHPKVTVSEICVNFDSNDHPYKVHT